MAVRAFPPLIPVNSPASESPFSKSELYRLAARGLIKMVHHGKRTFVTGESLSEYVDGLPVVQPRAQASS